ncbi:solute carrier family 28 member 3-like [Protobothrops mucrosquamatus]|uniref:solute carrier family 28 member 3-like n=1 Tax=Protobothrops mucrosquamatus TaxID=103944 RepID=UPI000775EED3|nr:solute carrier family 28 member 3-like [Protobothrops mucrosquamatus]
MSTVNRTSSNSYQNPGFEEDTDDSKINGIALRNRNLESSNSLHPDEHETNINIDSKPYGSQPESEENKNLGCKGKLARKYDMVLQFCRKHKTIIRYIIYGILITDN